MYHYLSLHIGLVFSLAEGNKVAWIRDYPRLLRLVLPRKVFVKMKGEGGEGTSESYPLLLHRLPFHLRKFFFIKRKGIVGIGGYPLPPSQTTSSS